MDTKVCAQPVEEDEEEGSEYEYEYEYETESDEEENMDEGNTLETEEASGTIKIHPVVIEQIECSPEEMIDDSTNQDIFEKPSLTREQIRAMKPKLPAYITSPEPCEFCDDPCTWIAWMEAQVNTERDRRMKEILSQNSEDPEVNPEEEICQPPSMEFDQSPVVKDGTNLVETKGEEEICPEPIAVDSMLEKETPEISGQNCSIKSKSFTDTVASPANVDAMDYKQKEQDSASEWEYETDEEHEEAKNVDEKIVIDVVEHENVETIEQETTNFVMAEDCNNNRKMSNNNEETSMDVEVSQEQIDITDESKDSFTDKLQPPIYKKQMSCPAISLVPDDIQKKLDFIRKKKASHGQLGGEIPTISPNNSILDEETQRKLSFIRQKKILAAQENVSENSNGALVRQMSTPENCPRPQSMNSDSSLDDMLARIKILREERKQILQDMSAIKNAFETNEPHDKVEMSIPDDGIASGNNTPNSEMFHSFHNDDTSGKTSPTISASMLSRHSRRSIDSGIGSKSMCSMQDGSPTAEIEAHAGKSTGSAHLGNDSCGKRKINRDKVSSEGEFFCFICGDNLGKLTKGAIMHMGLEDGDPVCADALYLTDDSKEKIRQIATTKMFTFEAKYDLLETLELETWDIDYEIPAGDVMKKVDAFLLDVEEQKVRDKEKFDAMRSGAIDDVFNEEFADLINSKYSSDTLENEYMEEPNTSDQYSNVPAVPSYRRELEMRSISASTVPAPPPPPPSAIQSSIKSKPALSNALLASIQQGGTNLRHAETIDKSEIKVGQVIHRHIAPIVFNRDIRSLVKDIAKEGTHNAAFNLSPPLLNPVIFLKKNYFFNCV